MTARNRAVWESIDKRINKLETDKKRLIATLAGLLKYDGGDGEYDAGLCLGYRDDAKKLLAEMTDQKERK